MKTSVVIRAFNEGAHIEKLLLGINAQSQRPFEVILVDSGSTDSTVAIARDYGCKIVSIEKARFTFGRALNIGCAAATGDVLVFASAHVYPLYSDWLERLIEPFSNERIVLSYGRQRGAAVNKFSEHQIFARWFPAQSAVPQRSHFCNNANCAVRRSSWESQHFDETLTGLEDLAWAKSAQAKGGLLAYVAEAEIVHIHDESWQQVRNRYRREAIAMRTIDEHARFTRADLVSLLTRNVFHDLRAAWRQGVVAREWSSIARFRYNQFVGTYLGYNGPPDVSAELRARFYYPESAASVAQPGDESGRQLLDYDRLITSRAVGGAAARASRPVADTSARAGVAIAGTIGVSRSSQ